MEDEIPEKQPERRTRRRVKELASDSPAEIFLEPVDDGLVSPLDRETVGRTLDLIGSRLASSSPDEWIDEDGRVRLILGADRLIVRFALKGENAEQMARPLDACFDLCFDLAAKLRLDVVDPQMSAVITRFRYEQQFPRILEAYHRKSRMGAALADAKQWKVLSSPGRSVPMTSAVPAFESEVEALPPTWSKKGRRLGTLELAGERAMAALQVVSPACPFLAILPVAALPGDDATLLRILRISFPVPGGALVEALSEGNAKVKRVHRTSDGITVAIG